LVVAPAPSDASAYKRGWIVEFGDASQSSLVFKRIVGLPGEKVDLINGSVSINGTILAESYLVAGTQTEPQGTSSSWQVGAQELFMLGDARPTSSDSRMYGPVSIASVKGHAVAICGPSARVALLP
jgi:signal peptidase I